jgi:hypothetical protein
VRVRVEFRHNPETGEFEVRVDDIGEGPRSADHDAAHERIASSVAGIIAPLGRLEEIAGSPPPVQVGLEGPVREGPETEDPQRTRQGRLSG